LQTHYMCFIVCKSDSGIVSETKIVAKKIHHIFNYGFSGANTSFFAWHGTRKTFISI